MLEYCLKNDDLHDPFVNDDDLVALGVCTREDLAEIAPLARRINEALIEIFAKIDVKLVDFKIEMGRTSDGTLLLADEISPDSCRLWDQRDHSGKVEHLDKDLFRRNPGRHHPGLRRNRKPFGRTRQSPKALKSQSNAFASPHLRWKPDAGFIFKSSYFLIFRSNFLIFKYDYQTPLSRS